MDRSFKEARVADVASQNLPASAIVAVFRSCRPDLREVESVPAVKRAQFVPFAFADGVSMTSFIKDLFRSCSVGADASCFETPSDIRRQEDIRYI
jgi:hypothetical protein